MATQNGRVRFNVGGQIFETTTTALSKAGEKSILRTMLDDAQYKVFGGEHFIDRDPACFNVLLHLLRSDELIVPPTIPDKLLFREAHYFGLLDQVRAAKSLGLDGDNLELTSSIDGRTLLNEDDDGALIRADGILTSSIPGRNLLNEKGALIRASDMGSCSVANGKLFHVYDWMLQEHSIGNFEYMKIVDMDWYDSESIVISGRKHYSNLNSSGGGVGLFNAQTAKLKHKFQLTQTQVAAEDDDQFFTMTPENLAVDKLNNKIFCSCKGYSYRKMDAIGVWDSTTGQQVGFLQGKHIGDLRNTFKLQWLPSNNCLVAASSDGTNNKISIFDPRSKENCPPCEVQRRGISVDMVGMEEKNCVCVVDEQGNIEFVDLRRLGGKENRGQFLWARETQRAIPLFLFPKVRSHGGKIFCSTNNIISVYSWTGFEFESTSRVQPRHGGAPIRDFSIGGDRLFSLQAHKEPSLYDIKVWETPRALPPILM